MCEQHSDSASSADREVEFASPALEAVQASSRGSSVSDRGSEMSMGRSSCFVEMDRRIEAPDVGLCGRGRGEEARLGMRVCVGWIHE